MTDTQVYRKTACENYFKAKFYSNNKWGIPELELFKKEEFDLNKIETIPFNYVKTTKDLSNKLVHFFIDDYQFERLWNNPEKYINMLKKAKYVLTPDFSLYNDMDLAIQLYNTYKNRWVGAYLQSEGIKVIPTVSWSTEESYDFCFKGIEEGNVVAIATYGIKQSEETKKLFYKGYKEMKRRVKPSVILCYGENEVPKECIKIETYIKKWRS